MTIDIYLIKQIVREELDSKLRQNIFLDIFNQYQTKRTIENICNKISEETSDKIFKRNMDIYRKDIFSNLKYYSMYDPELNIFRNKSIEEFTKIINTEVNNKILLSKKQIDEHINLKINDFLSIPIFEQIAQINSNKVISQLDKKISSEITPKISSINQFTWINLGLGIINTIGLVTMYINSK